MSETETVKREALANVSARWDIPVADVTAEISRQQGATAFERATLREAVDFAQRACFELAGR